MKQFRFLSCALILLLSGCAGFAGDINKAMEIRRSSSVDTKKTFDESKVVYIKELRCYAYRDDNNKKDIDSILFDAAGKKIMARDEAIEHVKFHYGDKGFSTGEKIAYFSTAVWVVPVGLVFTVAENIAMLPAFPYVSHLKNKFERAAIEYYQAGKELAEQGRYSEARQKYFLVLSGSRSLIYSSDINYQIAETYDNEGNVVLAEKYYRNFLEYSVALYPDFFQERDSRLTNDRAILDRELSVAEAKLNKVLTNRSRPTL